MHLLLTRLILSRTVVCDTILENITLQEIGGDLAQGDCAGKGHHKAGAEAAQGRPRYSGTQPSPLFKFLSILHHHALFCICHQRLCLLYSVAKP
jgi:hypothetical protein